MYVLGTSCLKVEINEFRCYEARIEESEKGRQSLGVEPRTPLAWAANALPLSHDSRTTTNPRLITSKFIYLHVYSISVMLFNFYKQIACTFYFLLVCLGSGSGCILPRLFLPLCLPRDHAGQSHFLLVGRGVSSGRLPLQTLRLQQQRALLQVHTYSWQSVVANIQIFITMESFPGLP